MDFSTGVKSAITLHDHLLRSIYERHEEALLKETPEIRSMILQEAYDAAR